MDDVAVPGWRFRVGQVGQNPGRRAVNSRRIDDLAPGGGYVLTPRWAVRPEVPPENLRAIYEAVEEYGRSWART